MQKRVEDVMEQLETERIDLVAKTLDRCMSLIDCQNIDWRMFKIYEKSEKYVFAMLDKLQAHFFIAAATAADVARKASEVEIIVTEGDDSETDELSTIINRGTLYITITLSKESQKFLTQ